MTTGPNPLAIMADRGGTITALARPLNANEHAATGHWLEAAAVYAKLGQLSRGAELLAAHDEPLKAAQLWHVAGELAQAAAQYEVAKAWSQATGLWQQLNRPLKQAEALEQFAQALAGEAANDEAKAEAWEITAQAFVAAGEDTRAEACRQEVGRYRCWPDLVVEVKHDGLLLNHWTRLRFTVHNRGHGAAHQLLIRARGGQFEGQVTETRQIITLQPGQTREDWLDVRPLAPGDSVPLRVSIDYQDQGGNSCAWERTIYLFVAQAGERQMAQETEPMTTMPPQPGDWTGMRGAVSRVSRPSSTPLGPIRHRWALLVGINHYIDPSFRRLNFCVNDVVTLAETLKEVGYTVVALHDDATEERLQPDNDNIEAELTKLCQVVQPEDLLWVHFAGHGLVIDGQPVLVTRRTRQATLAKSALPLARVEQHMRDSQARRLVLTLDACHVGVDLGRDVSDPEFIRHAHELAEGFALIAASTAQQKAQEWQEKEHGVFTYYLLEGLTGQAAREENEFVTVDDLKTYALDHLRRWSVEHGGLLQDPSARTEGLGDMILADFRD
jgi:hypothetical protein